MMEFHINGNVPHVCPRCWGRNPKRMTRPLPMETSASAILPARYFSPSSQPERNTSLPAYRATTRTRDSPSAVGSKAELFIKYAATSFDIERDIRSDVFTLIRRIEPGQ